MLHNSDELTKLLNGLVVKPLFVTFLCTAGMIMSNGAVIPNDGLGIRRKTTLLTNI